MNFKNPIIYVCVGIASGLASYFLLDLFGDGGLFFGPGVVFGLIFSIFVYFIFPKSKKRNIGLIIFPFISTLAYYCAVMSAIFTGGSIENDAFAYFVAGLVGAIIIVIPYHFLIKKLNLTSFLFTVFLGGVLGLSYPLTVPIFKENFQFGRMEDMGFSVLFVVWQAGMFYNLTNLIKE